MAVIRELTYIRYILSRPSMQLEKSLTHSGFDPVTFRATVPNLTSRPSSHLSPLSLLLFSDAEITLFYLVKKDASAGFDPAT